MACWKARAEFLLSVIELLLLSLMVQALQDKMFQHSLPSGGCGSDSAKISGGRGRPPANIFIPLERQLIALQLCCWQFLYNETLQQTSRPLLLKLVWKTTNLGIWSHFEEVRGGVEPWLMARWKACIRLPIRHNWTFFASSYCWGATRQNVKRLAVIRRG